jgi:hypothetical protein
VGGQGREGNLPVVLDTFFRCPGQRGYRTPVFFSVQVQYPYLKTDHFRSYRGTVVLHLKKLVIVRFLLDTPVITRPKLI